MRITTKEKLGQCKTRMRVGRKIYYSFCDNKIPNNWIVKEQPYVRCRTKDLREQ